MEQRHSGGRSSFGGGRNQAGRRPSRFSRRPAFRSRTNDSSARATTASQSGERSYTSGPRRDSNVGGNDRPRRGAPSRGGYQSGGYAFSRGGRSSFSGGRSGSSFGGRGGSFSRGGSRGGHKGPQDEKIDVSRFVNKAVITEEVEHFIPEHAFTDFKIREDLKRAITAKGYSSPTPIQDRSIPHVLHGADVVGIANTGTGKTGAFLIPLINKVLENPRESVLIVVPTRELATQINDELTGFVKQMNIRSVCVFGGANINRHIDALKTHRHFVIGTPGRLKDLMERRKLNLSTFRTAVLDEADRMLDMGFVHDMRFIIGTMPKERQTLFYSATLSPDVEKLIHEFLNQPVRISVKTRDTSKNIDQDVVHVPRGGSKFDVLVELLRKPEFTRTLVFGRTKHGVDKLTKLLMRAGITAESIHGNKNNNKRQLALRLFKEGRVKALIATDVAARGLDIADVSHVINYDLPATYDDYVHRIGRTGRGSKKGSAITLIEG